MTEVYGDRASRDKVPRDTGLTPRRLTVGERQRDFRVMGEQMKIMLHVHCPKGEERDNIERCIDTVVEEAGQLTAKEDNPQG